MRNLDLFLFQIVLPLACVVNSRYMTEKHLIEMTSSLGFDVISQHHSRKLSFVFFRKSKTVADKRYMYFSLAPERCDRNSKSVISEYMLEIKFMNTFCGIALMFRPGNIFDEKSTLLQVMAWCLQAPSHYLSQCWPGSMSPYDVNRPQWINLQLIVA